MILPLAIIISAFLPIGTQTPNKTHFLNQIRVIQIFYKNNPRRELVFSNMSLKIFLFYVLLFKQDLIIFSLLPMDFRELIPDDITRLDKYAVSAELFACTVIFLAFMMLATLIIVIFWAIRAWNGYYNLDYQADF